MSAALKLLLYVLVLSPLILGGLFVERHPDWLRQQILALSSREDASAPRRETSRSAGRHALTESAPVSVPDLDRLVAVGFTTDQIVSEIRRRGVLRLPDPAERSRVENLPGGSRLLDAMDSPQNLLDDDALARFGRRQAEGVNFEQIHSTATEAMRASALQVRVQANSAQMQLQADYQRRRNALIGQLASLKQKRASMQRRGEVTVMISMEIERLERERDALVAPF